MRVKPRRQPNTNSRSELIVCLSIIVILVYGVITWHAFGWGRYRSLSNNGSSDSSLSRTGGRTGPNAGEDGEDSLDHFLESILIEGFPTHLIKKERNKQAVSALYEQSSSNKASSSFRKPRLRGT